MSPQVPAHADDVSMANTLRGQAIRTTAKRPAKTAAPMTLKTASPTANWAEIFALQPVQENA